MTTMKPLTTLRRLAVWLCRLRHRCGYGIHSPFAYHFVTAVVYERSAYYAYAPLHDLRRRHPSALREKDDRMLLRVANAAAAHTAIVWGKHTATTLRYLRAGRTTCSYHHVATPTPAQIDSTIAQTPALDFLYVDDPLLWTTLFRRALSVATPHACFVVRGIHQGRRSRRAWHEVCADKRIRVTFDLYDFGIAFFEPRLHKQDYLVNYF